jgi:hypothetical protein
MWNFAFLIVMFMRLLLILVLFGCCGVVFGQKRAVSGLVTDKAENKIVTGATVVLINKADTNSIQRKVTGERGFFRFEDVGIGKYLLRVETVNYSLFTQEVDVADTGVNRIAVQLLPKNKDLAGVTIVAKGSAVTTKEDTVQYSASQYKVNPDATAEDLIKKMPGITVDRSGTVTAQGETVRKVTIDGKDFFGDDASAALKNIGADAVDKIQVFDRLSDQARLTGFDDGNSQKAINVVTKAGVKNGQFGRVFAGIGTKETYNVGGNVSFFKGTRRISLVGTLNNINQQNFASQDLQGATGSGGQGGSSSGMRGSTGGRGGPPSMFGGGGQDFNVQQAAGISKTAALGINYSNEFTKKLTLTGSYFYNRSVNDANAIINTELFNKKDTSLFNNQNSTTKTTNANHRLNMRMEWNIDSLNSIYIIPSISFQENLSVNDNSLSGIFGAPSATKFYDTSRIRTGLNTNDRNSYNIRTNVLYRHAFAKKGRSINLGVNIALTKNNTETINDARDLYYIANVLTKDSLQNQFSDNISNGNTYGASVAYTEPLSKKAQLQFDYTPSIQKNDADQKTFDSDGTKYTLLQTRLSNVFTNEATTQNFGISYRLVPGREELFQIGVNFQNTQLQSDRTFPTATSVNQKFNNIIPNLSFRKKFNAASNIRLFYRPNITLPSVNQLQDVVTLTNAQRVSVGNPLLKQAFAQFFGGRYAYTNTKTKKSFFAGVFTQLANNFIANETFIIQGDSIIQGNVLKRGTELSRPVNVKGYGLVRSFASYSLPIKQIKSNLTLTTSVFYQNLPSLVNNNTVTTKNAQWTTGFNIASNINEYVDFTVSYNFNANNNNNSASGKNNFINHVASAQVNLLSKKGWFIQQDVTYQTNNGLSGGLNQNFTLWNAAIGKKFLPKRVGELKLSVFDLLNQNTSISRTVDNRSIEDAQYQVLRQYFMLTFTYSLKNFGKAKASTKPDNKEEVNRFMGGRP